MSLKSNPRIPNRRAPPPPTAQTKPQYGQQGTKLSQFDPYAKSDSNNNKTPQVSAFNRPTVIRPQATQGKKKPPPRPAPPKHLLVRKNAVKRTKSSVRSPTPDLLADLEEIFRPQPQPSPTCSRSSVKKLRAPQPQWQKNSTDGALIDFNAPSPIHQSSSTPSFTKTLLDEDLNDAFTTTVSSSSLQDLFCMPVNTNKSDPFADDFFGRTNAGSTNRSTSGFGDFNKQNPFNDNWPDPFAPVSHETTTRHSSFDSTSGSTAKVTSSSSSGSLFQNHIFSNKAAAATPPKNGLLNRCAHSSFKMESSTDHAASEWSIDHVASPPEPKFPPPPPPPEMCPDSEKWCIALYDFEAQTSEELRLSVGDIIFVEKKINADWWKGQLNGRNGLFPATYVEPVTADSTNEPNRSFSHTSTKEQNLPANKESSQMDVHCYATAMYQFQAEQDGDLSFEDGAVIEVLYRINQDWLYGKYNNKEGQFPANFVRKVSAERNEKLVEVIASYDFRGEKDDELTFREGDLILVTEKISSDWSMGYLKNDESCKVGCFPTAFTIPTR